MVKQMYNILFGIVVLVTLTHSIPLMDDLLDELGSENQELAEARSILDTEEDMFSDSDDQPEARDVSSEELPATRREFLVPDELFERRSQSFTSAQRRFQKEMLQAHNMYRARHCASPLKLDENLNKKAQAYAVYLASINRLVHSKDNTGENLYATEASGQISGKVAAASWYSEIKQYNFRRGGFTMQTGHFTQLVWKGSQKLGVGIATGRSGKTYVVAQYSPSGNMKGKFQTNVLPAKC